MNSQTNKLQSSLTELIALAKQKHLDQIEISASIEKGFVVNARMGDVETLEHHQSNNLSITVYHQHHTGSASTSDLSKPALLTAFEKAAAIASYTNEDPYSGLADEKFMAFNYPDLSLNHEWKIDPKRAIELAIECENLARQYDPRITRTEGASVYTYLTNHFYANSHGFFGNYDSTHHGYNCSVIAEENGVMQGESDYTQAHDPKKLASVEVVAHHAAERAIRRLGARKLSTRRCAVIYQAQVAKSLLHHLISAISGSSLYRGASFLCDHLEKIIFPETLNVYQDPHRLNEIGSAPYDDQGVRTKKLSYIENGRLTNYVLGAYSAKKLGMETTGNSGGVHNFFLMGKPVSFDAMLKQIGTGLLVTELMGQGVNITTGDYSRGAFGYWVENGEIQYPVEEITIAGNLREMFKKISLLADDVDRRGNIKTGSIVIDQMTVAGQ